MNIARHMRKLNALLASELGSDPLYQWVWSEDPEFRHAMQKTDEWDRPVLDYVCKCGKNVRVHEASCHKHGLVIARPVYEWRKIDITLRNQWVLCALRPPVLSESEWLDVFGTKALYPKHGEWMPVATETRTVALPPDQYPSEQFNLCVIRGKQKARLKEEGEEPWDYEAAEQKRLDARLEGYKYRFKSVMPVRPNPGCVDGPVSLPSVSTSKGSSL